MKTQDVQIKTGTDENYEYYETRPGDHYFKLSFERAPSRQNYSELKSLEEQYYSIKNPVFPYAPSFISLLWIILMVGGLLLYVIPGIILLIVHIVRYVKQNKKWHEDYLIYEQQVAACKEQRIICNCFIFDNRNVFSCTTIAKRALWW